MFLSGYKDLWEVRSKLTGGRIARVIFYISQGEMILLHGNIGEVSKNPQTGNRFSSQAQEGTRKI